MPGLKNRFMDEIIRVVRRYMRLEICAIYKINWHETPDDQKFNSVDVIMRDRAMKDSQNPIRKQLPVLQHFMGGHCGGNNWNPRVGDLVWVFFYGGRQGIVLGNVWSWAEYPVCRPTPYDIADKGGQWMEPFQDKWGDFPKQPYPALKKPYCFRWFHGPVTGTTGKGRDWAWLFDYCHEGDCTPECPGCDIIDDIGRCDNHGFKFYSTETESKISHPERGEYFAPCGSYWMFESKCCCDCEHCTEEQCCSEIYTEGKGFWEIRGATSTKAEDQKGHIRHTPDGTLEGHSATPAAAQEDNVGSRWKVYAPANTTADSHGLIAAELINLEKKAVVRIYKDGAIRVRASTDVTGANGKSEVFLGVDGHCWLWDLVDNTYIEFFPGGGCTLKADPITLDGNVTITGSLTHGGGACCSGRWSE